MVSSGVDQEEMHCLLLLTTTCTLGEGSLLEADLGLFPLPRFVLVLYFPSFITLKAFGTSVIV